MSQLRQDSPTSRALAFVLGGAIPFALLLLRAALCWGGIYVAFLEASSALLDILLMFGLLGCFTSLLVLLFTPLFGRSKRRAHAKAAVGTPKRGSNGRWLFSEPMWLLGRAYWSVLGFCLAYLPALMLVDERLFVKGAYLRWQESQAHLPAVIERYRLDRGSYPTEFAALVPDYLAEVPVAPGGRWFRIEVSNGDEDHMGNPWILMAGVPTTGSFDSMVYHPNGRYPEGSAYGGGLEPWGSWMYVHE